MKIESFTGRYRFLSNFWPCTVVYERLAYPSVEHAYQAAKTTDELARRIICNQPSPGCAKRYGRGLSLRPFWDSMKLQVMEDLLWHKFSTPELQRALRETGDAELIEVNNWNDTYWGVCRGVGENNLGKLLMRIREACKP